MAREDAHRQRPLTMGVGLAYTDVNGGPRNTALNI